MYFSDECACRQIHSGLFGKRLKKQSNRFSIKCNPSVSSWHLPYILRCKTQGRRVILSCVSCLFFSPYCWATPRNTTGHGREEVNTLRCIVFVFLPTIFSCENTPQCYGTGQGGGLSSTLYSLLWMRCEYLLYLLEIGKVFFSDWFIVFY